VSLDKLHYYRELRSAEGSVFGAVSLCFLFVYEMPREPLNGLAPNSHGRRVWSLARKSLKVKDKNACSASSAAYVQFYVC